jgi:hypothetical protein
MLSMKENAMTIPVEACDHETRECVDGDLSIHWCQECGAVMAVDTDNTIMDGSVRLPRRCLLVDK